MAWSCDSIEAPRGAGSITRWRRYAITILAVACTLVVISACTTATAPVPVQSITLLPANDSVETGASTSGFLVTLLDRSGKVVTGRTPKWTSSDQSIATVDAGGKVHGVAVGQAIITAEIDGARATATVRVITALAQIVLTPDSLDVPLGTSKSFTVQLLGSHGEAISGRVMQWAVASPAIATVSANGTVNAVAQGNTIVTVTVGTKTATGKVHVSAEPVAVVKIQPAVSVQIVRLGQTFQLGATCYNAALQVLSGRTIQWITNNPSVASVSSNGLVTGLAVGSATITADCEGKTAQILIQVTLVAVSTVTVTPDSLTMFTNQSQQLTATAKDSVGNALTLNGRAVIWSSDNLPVASVSSSGVVSSISPGTANVRVTIDNVPSNAVNVTVKLVPVATVQITPNPASVKVGFQVTLRAVLMDASGNTLSNTGRTIVWTSSDDTIASVSVNGIVTGVKVGGPITITATCEGVSGTAQVTVVP